jgi:hypothetical protein
MGLFKKDVVEELDDEINALVKQGQLRSHEAVAKSKLENAPAPKVGNVKMETLKEALNALKRVNPESPIEIDNYIEKYADVYDSERCSYWGGLFVIGGGMVKLVDGKPVYMVDEPTPEEMVNL